MSDVGCRMPDVGTRKWTDGDRGADPIVSFAPPRGHPAPSRLCVEHSLPPATSHRPPATRMELSHLRYFEAVARLGNVTRAAAEQHIAQPSLSKAIRALERQLGAQLFHRVGRRVELSDAGRTLLPYARRVLQEVAAAREALKARD